MGRGARHRADQRRPKGPAPDTVVPLFCVECDANIWFRWSGEEYEAELYAVGEKIDIGSETQADLPLYSSPNLASKPVTTVAHCTTVVVRKVGGTPDARWYFVETPEAQRGWISDKVTAPTSASGNTVFRHRGTETQRFPFL